MKLKVSIRGEPPIRLRRHVLFVVVLVSVLVFEHFGAITHLQALLGETVPTSAAGSYLEQENASSSSTEIVSNGIVEFITPAASNNTTTRKEDSGLNQTRKILFVHIGKTGGTTLRETVLRYGCRFFGSRKARAKCKKSLAVRGESKLEQTTTGIFHYEVPKSKQQRDSMDLLFSVREPISRFQSSYEFINPHNCIPSQKDRAWIQKCNSKKRALNDPTSFDAQFYYDCFPTIESFMSYVPASKDNNSRKKTTNPDMCQHLWLEAFRPSRSAYGHMTANYQYYTKHKGFMSRKKGRKVYVIRTEHLWEDVSNIDRIVGGTGNYSTVKKKTINKQTTAKHVGPTMQYVPHSFCCALLPDMLVFRGIINRADNFDEQTKQATNERSWSRCNVTSWEMLETRCKSTK